MFGVALGIFRSYLDTKDFEERKKIRKIKHLLKKKTKDIFLDYRITGIVGCLLLFGLPYYLGHESKNPAFFGMYSSKVMIVLVIYFNLMIVALVYPLTNLEKNIEINKNVNIKNKK